MSTALITSYPAPPFCEKEILRYAGCQSAEAEVVALMRACIKELEQKLSYHVCYREFPLRVEGNVCDFGVFCLTSKQLAKRLQGCQGVVVFAATVGIEIDRRILKYGRLAPSKALMMQAIGAERIEALCDVFCQDLAREKGMGITARFSPGYGDLELATQKHIFDVLPCARIGLYLNESLLMSPSKSVTAFIGYKEGAAVASGHDCAACNKTECTFRRKA